MRFQPQSGRLVLHCALLIAVLVLISIALSGHNKHQMLQLADGTRFELLRAKSGTNQLSFVWAKTWPETIASIRRLNSPWDSFSAKVHYTNGAAWLLFQRTSPTGRLTNAWNGSELLSITDSRGNTTFAHRRMVLWGSFWDGTQGRILSENIIYEIPVTLGEPLQIRIVETNRADSVVKEHSLSIHAPR